MQLSGRGATTIRLPRLVTSLRKYWHMLAMVCGCEIMGKYKQYNATSRGIDLHIMVSGEKSFISPTK